MFNTNEYYLNNNLKLNYGIQTKKKFHFQNFNIVYLKYVNLECINTEIHS